MYVCMYLRIPARYGLFLGDEKKGPFTASSVALPVASSCSPKGKARPPPIEPPTPTQGDLKAPSAVIVHRLQEEAVSLGLLHPCGLSPQVSKFLRKARREPSGRPSPPLQVVLPCHLARYPLSPSLVADVASDPGFILHSHYLQLPGPRQPRPVLAQLGRLQALLMDAEADDHVYYPLGPALLRQAVYP